MSTTEEVSEKMRKVNFQMLRWLVNVGKIQSHHSFIYPMLNILLQIGLENVNVQFMHLSYAEYFVAIIDRSTVHRCKSLFISLEFY